AGAAAGIQGEAPAATLALWAVDQLAHADIRVQPSGVTFRQLETKEAAPAMAEDEDLVLAELAADPAGHFLRIGDHSLACQRRRDCRRIAEEMRLSRGALVPLHDREEFFPAAGKPPTHRHRDVPRPAVDVEQHRIPSIGAPDRDPLIDATDGYSLYPFHTTWRHDLARIADDGPRLDSCRRLRPVAHFCSDRNQHREQRQHAWRQ